MGTQRGDDGQAPLQLDVRGHAEAPAAPVGVGAFLPQKELGQVVHGDWPQGWPAEGDLQEGSFQLLAATKPALKGSAAEGVCPSQSWPQSSLAPCRRGSRATTAGRGRALSPLFHQGASCTPRGVRKGSWPGCPAGCCVWVQGDVMSGMWLPGCTGASGQQEWGGGRVEALAGHVCLPSHSARHCLSISA